MDHQRDQNPVFYRVCSSGEYFDTTGGVQCENDQDVDWSNEEEKEWQMKTIVEKYLLLWAIFDFVLQIIA